MIRIDLKNCNTLLTEKQENYQYYHVEKFININKPCNQIRVIGQAQLTDSPLGKDSEKQPKEIDNQSQKQINAIEDHEKQLVTYNELIKKDFNIDRGSIPLEEQNNA